MPKVMSKLDSLESLYYVWGTKPIDHLFKDEVEQFHEDLDLANIPETEYMDYARSQCGVIDLKPTGTKTFIIKGEEFKTIKEYDTFYLCISEFGFNLKRIPKVVRIK